MVLVLREEEIPVEIRVNIGGLILPKSLSKRNTANGRFQTRQKRK